MRIAVISTNIFPCPPTAYSGLEMVAYLCAENLAKAGHRVMLVAPVGSTPPKGVELHPTTQGEPERQSFQFGYRRRLQDFDVIIDHSWEKWSYIEKIESNPRLKIIGVCHCPIETMYLSPPPIPKPCLLGLSQDQAERIKKHLKVDARYVYNGIDMDFYKPTPGAVRSERFLFMGRMSGIKGPHVAVEIAKSLGLELDVVGDDKFTQEHDYAKKVKSECDGERIRYWGGVSREKTVELYSTRKALLNTIQWDAEPFGLVMVEAMACGMPVFAFNRGSPKEILVHGETGFVVNSTVEMEWAIRNMPPIDSETCRSRAAMFSKERMGREYLNLCEDVLNGREW